MTHKDKLCDISEYSDYYQATAYCFNCGKSNTTYVRKGVTLNNVSRACDKCGCTINMKNGRSDGMVNV